MATLWEFEIEMNQGGETGDAERTLLPGQLPCPVSSALSGCLILSQGLQNSTAPCLDLDLGLSGKVGGGWRGWIANFGSETPVDFPAISAPPTHTQKDPLA